MVRSSTPYSSAFLSTLSLRRATSGGGKCRKTAYISIHALLAESDAAPTSAPTPPNNFYPRSPCGERRAGELLVIQSVDEFLSTLSLRRATRPHRSGGASQQYFYPRSPCGERPAFVQLQQHPVGISIHALLAESDRNFGNSLSSWRISIHALLAESDRKMLQKIGSFCSQTCYTTITIRDF